MMRTHLFFLSFALCILFAAAPVQAQDLIVNGTTVTMGGIHHYDTITVVNGGVIKVTPFNGTDRVNTGNLQLVAASIYVDATSSIIATGSGYQPLLCQNGTGPAATPLSGGRGGCAVRDSGGGGAHFGGGGRGTRDCPGGICTFPHDWEENCGTYAGGTTCTTIAACYDGDGLPTVAGQPYTHSIYEIEFGASGGDAGCRDGDGWSIPICMVAGPGGGRIVLAAVTPLGTGVLDIRGRIIAEGRRGCGIKNDSAGGGAGGSVLLASDNVNIGQSAVISTAGGIGGNTQPYPAGECPACGQTSGTCDDCGGGGGGGIVSVLSGAPAVIHQLAEFKVGGAAGGVCSCAGEAGGGAGELQLSGVYVGEVCDGYDNDFDDIVDNDLPDRTCGIGGCEVTVPACTAGGLPNDCVPADDPLCQPPITDTRSRFMVIVDTSGSMLLDLSGVWTFGDGSPDHPGVDTNTSNGSTSNDSRLYKAKEALRNVISAYYPDIDFGLARYAQGSGPNVNCQLARSFECAGVCCTYDNPLNNFGAPAACTVNAGAAGNLSVLPQSPVSDACVNYAGGCGSVRRGADILVGFERPVNQLIMWIDNKETNFNESRTEGDFCDFAGGGDCELRGTGPTPLADSLLAVKGYMAAAIANDRIDTCRRYSVILLTDGMETCRGNPVTAAAELLNDLGVETYIIGFSVLASEQTSLNQIARAGSFGSSRDAFFVGNEDELATVLAGIVADSVVYELCNDWDDDCDGLVDEDFPTKGLACDNGLIGACYRTGTFQCSIDQTSVTCSAPSVSPIAEVCNGIDDNCNGLIDDGLTCPTPGPEMCNGLDDDLDSSTDDDGVDDPSVGKPCGTSTGICDIGLTKCIGGSVQCCATGGLPGVCGFVQGPVAETCNNLDDDCDGPVDEGLSKGCYPGATIGCTETAADSGIFNCVGLCRAGIHSCSAGSWGTCQGAIIPQDEICDGQNNDCDAATDEELGTTTCGLGICLHNVDNCSSGITQTCDPMEGASAEVCNNSDDDCNGIIDDGLVRGCYSDSAGCTETAPDSHNYVCVGRCTAGSSFCAGGSWGTTCQNEVVRQAEECNNLDDDCDGSIDESLSRACYTGPTGTLNVGICIGGTQTCTTGAWGTCAGEIRPGTEICNNIDDNCDDEVDNMGLLTCGLGICNHSVQRCIAGETQTCDPMEGATTELCNNLDDNCDGIIDQFYGGCYPTATDGCTETAFGSGIFVCIGACQSGTRLCTAGSWSPTCNAAVIPATEICDGIDNDCDGDIDEGFGETTCGLGVCAHNIQNCSGGALQTCDPMLGAGVETCNNADDDCDGVIDDGLSRACYGGASGCTETAPDSGIFNCTGVCRSGTSVCSTGTWGTCLNDVQPGTEECNGFDDNCDGSTDEGLSRNCYTGPDGTLGVGLCHGGNQTCSSGAWNTCTGEIKPVPEVCDTFDNNCDGLPDNMGETTCGLGSCLHTVQNCVAGAVQTCDPLLGASVEICDTLDNDCDGQSDGLTEACYPTATLGCTWNAGTSSFDCHGSCSAGQRRCPIDSGAWGECENAVIPEIEICDGIDNNCDGDIDEGLTEVCYPPGSGTNTGCEDQGDGTWICQGVCAIGHRECTLGGWGTCGGLVIPTQEICDTLDNDCDGFTDESEDIPGMGQPCGGVGVCAPGIRACINGIVVCDGGGDPQPGLCDGLDNNCNGLVDEPAELMEDPRVGGPCGEDDGACTEGTNECINGGLLCVGGNGPTSEICNGIDDDCDTFIDTGDICPINEICYTAECRLVCNPAEEQPCPAGFACIEPQDLTGTYLCYPQLAPCGGIYCAEDEVCREGACANPCEPDPCESFERCWVNRYAGQVGHETEPEFYCFDDSCSAVGNSCPNGELCINHACVDDPCAASPCSFTSEYCVRTNCETQETCSYECLDVPFCYLGERWDVEQQKCMADACYNTLCESGLLCINGSCENDLCFLMNCGWGQACILGECLPDPCHDIKCPSYTHCYIDQSNGGAWCEPNPGVWTPPIPGDTMTSGGGSCSSNPGPDSAGLGFVGLLMLTLAFLFMRGRRLSRIPGFRRAGLGTIVALFLLSSCQWAEFSLESPGVKILPDAEVIPDAEPDADVDVVTCVPSDETCDGEDNDCNGVVDDYWAPVASGGQGHFTDDPFNCGHCGNICAYVHAGALCVDGQCAMGPCHPNWYDFDDRDENGCETSCLISAGGQEICDSTDNDCNGVVDDPWIPAAEGGLDGFMDDPNNCGVCGRICAFPNGQGSCTGGQCELSGCNENFVDTDGLSANGCECIMSAQDDSTCDGVDNDCNGQTDEDYVLRQCFTGGGCIPNGDGTFACTGLCAPGTTTCSGGREQCQGQTSPALEICDLADNDCDGSVDEGYNTQVDVNHCGACNHSCSANSPANMRSVGCSAGVCQYTCLAGFSDLDPGVPGCEYPCVISNNGIERCDDGIDNDCDGNTDEFNALTDVNNCGTCGYSCQSNAPSNMDAVSCTAGSCNFICAPSYYDYDPGTPGCETFCQVSNGGTEACDGADNDCDETVDEGFNKLTDAANCGSCNYVCADHLPPHMTATGCSAGNCQYACAGGYYNLDGLLSNGCEYACTITNSGIEICDNLDNDCNGRIDTQPDNSPLVENCYTGTGGTNGTGLCHGGTHQCYSGTWSPCQGEVIPVAELCDTLDNDCDSSVDETFNLNTDVLNCGSCNRSCTAIKPPHTYASGCAAGVCQYQCSPGFYDIDLNRNTIGGNGCEYACTITNGGIERCDDTFDNDCDGTTDEYNGLTDPLNCGSCGYVCSAHAPVNMTTTGCSAGVCQYTCSANYYDTVPGTPGCEYYCTVTNSGTELCDSLDNDCDNIVDEGFNKLTDPLNCGACGYICANNTPQYMTATGCSAGNCTFTCQANHYNLDGLQSNGCEYACTVTNSGTEICDNLDNDCDGIKDENTAGTPLTQSCYTGLPSSTENVGPCHGGSQTCFTGIWGVCQGQVTPLTESCDTIDNDCDGTPDDGFNLNTDILNCGMCGISCFASVPTNASVASCTLGACRYTCNAGTYDIDGDLQLVGSNGCEYACTPTRLAGSEDCNDRDDDCDGATDEISDLVAPPAGYCKTGGACGVSVTSTCQLFGGVKQWVCNYPLDVDRLIGSPNLVAYAEVRCDGLDNDCDLSSDEDFLPLLSSACSDSNLGLCKGTGSYACKGDKSGTECVITTPGAPPSAELCDNIDNDCDGLVDNYDPDDPDRVLDDMVHINRDGLNFYIYRYEASRPDATPSSAGASEARPCSNAQVLPWASVTYADALSACARVGKRLCTAAEWEAACAGPDDLIYPYGDAYEEDACNGVDADGIPGGDDDDLLLPAGDLTQCVSPDGLFDMSGNLREWTNDLRGTTTMGDNVYVVRGGEYQTPWPGLTCAFDLSQAAASVPLPTVGFRCCSDTAP